MLIYVMYKAWNHPASLKYLMSGIRARFIVTYLKALFIFYKKKKATLWRLQWHIATFGDQVVALQRPSTGIWPTMWVFPESGPDAFSALGELHDPVTHLLTHRKIEAQFIGHRAPNMQALETYAQSVGGTTMSWEVLAQKARPRLMTKVFDELLSGLGSRE